MFNKTLKNVQVHEQDKHIICQFSFTRLNKNFFKEGNAQC